jgi:uncharacterized membrane protein
MRRLAFGLLLVPLVALIGCSGAGTPGGSGKHSGSGDHAANGSPKRAPIIGKEEGTFTLSVPSGLTATHIKQGESKEIKVGIKPAKGFQEDVTLKFDLPKGVTAEPAEPVIKASGDKEILVTLKADADAPTGGFEVKVTGKPKTGPEAGNTFKLTIDKK